MASYIFPVMKGRAEHRFTCPSCAKPNRIRAFTSEMTVNPYNRGADGLQKSASQVSREAAEDARKQRDQFAREPLCATCEGNLPDTDRRALRERRSA